MGRRASKVLLGTLLVAATAGPAAAPAATPSGFSVVAGPDAPGGKLFGVAAISARNVWAVGMADSPAGFNNLVEHYDGSRWSIVPIPHQGSFSSLRGISNNGLEMWTVGGYSKSSVHRGTAYKWNGTKWVSVPVPSQIAVLNTVQVFANVNVWAGGQDQSSRHVLAHWTGSSWTITTDAEEYGSGVFNQVEALTAVVDRLYAVGDQDTVTPFTGWMETSHEGGRWTDLGSWVVGAGVTRGISASSTRNVWAVGSKVAHGAYVPLAEKWDGSTLRQINPPGYATDHQLYADAAISPTNVWAVGSRANAADTRWSTLIDHYTAAGWQDLGGPNVGSGDNELRGIDEVPGDPSNLWAVGWSTTQPLILHHS